MKQIVFRPLRRIKKTGKITVASYNQWNSIRSANLEKFSLIVNDEYKDLPPGEQVFNHEGNLLFHFNYDPWEVFEYHGSCLDPLFNWDKLREEHKSFIIVSDSHKSYHMRGADCTGTPTFSHWDGERLTSEDTWNYYGGIDCFEPLTVGYVIKWLGWFLYNLENAELKVGK